MQREFEKIIERLEEEKTKAYNTYARYEMSVDLGRSFGAEKAIEIVNQVASEVGDGWIPCSERLPEEHDSIFAIFKGTDKWNNSMFEKVSDEVSVTIVGKNGIKATTHAHTIEGKWSCDLLKCDKSYQIIAWQPLPEPYQPKEEHMEQPLPISAPECGLNKLLKDKNLEKPHIEGGKCGGLYTEDDSGKRELWPVCSECQHHLQKGSKAQMGKAVLVIDMPESCSKCKFGYEFQGIKKCNLLNALCNGGKAIIPKDKYAECRYDACPLVELPEEDKKDHYPDVYRSGYTQGWNDYRGEILGDEF